MVDRKFFENKQGELGKFQKNKESYLLDRYKNSTKNTVLTYFRLFKLFVNIEETLDKDLYLFNEEEILDAIGNIPTYSERMLNSIFSLLDMYIENACQRGFNPTRRNPMKNLSVKTHLQQMIRKDVLTQRYITKKELYQMIEDIEKMAYSKKEKSSDADVRKSSYFELTAQDYICVLLPYYGIYGKDCCEMSNLKMKYVNAVSNTIMVVNNEGEVREVKVDEELIRLIEEANKQLDYGIKKNGDPKKLYENGFVLKSTKVGNQLYATGIRVRFAKVLDAYNSTKDDVSRLTMKSVVVSGKFEKLRELEQKKGKLEDQDFRDIMVEFGDNPTSYFGLKRDYYYTFGEDKKAD